MENVKADDLTHCMDFLRQADHDRYMAILYAPEDKRAALAGLYAFNAEIARIRDVVREALPGEIRLQWWRDLINNSVDADNDKPADDSGHPVANLLLYAIRQYDLPVQAFDDYCETRIFDLYNDPMPSRNDLEGYCGETASVIIQLAAMILNPESAKQVTDLSGHAGVAQAIAGLLRLMPLHRQRGQIYVPQDILQAVGVTGEEFLKGEDDAAMQRVVAAMAALARQHYDSFESGWRAQRNLHTQLSPAFLPVRLVPAFLGVARRNGADTARQTAEITQLRRQWIYLRSTLLG